MGDHFLSIRERENGTERTSNVAQVAVGCVLPTALCSMVYKLEVMQITTFGEGQE